MEISCKDTKSADTETNGSQCHVPSYDLFTTPTAHSRVRVMVFKWIIQKRRSFYESDVDGDGPLVSS